MMYVIYGLDTHSIEDPDQTVLLCLDGAEDCEDVQAVNDFIGDNWGTEKCIDQPVVGLDDVLESMRLALTAAKVSEAVIEDAVETIIDAVGNNLYG